MAFRRHGAAVGLIAKVIDAARVVGDSLIETVGRPRDVVKHPVNEAVAAGLDQRCVRIVADKSELLRSSRCLGPRQGR